MWETIYKEHYKEYRAWKKVRLAQGYREAHSSSYEWCRENPAYRNVFWVEYGRYPKRRRDRLQELREYMQAKVRFYIDKYITTDMVVLDFKSKIEREACYFYVLLDTKEGERLLSMKAVFVTGWQKQSHIRYNGFLKKNLQEFHNITHP